MVYNSRCRLSSPLPEYAPILQLKLGQHQQVGPMVSAPIPADVNAAFIVLRSIVMIPTEDMESHQLGDDPMVQPDDLTRTPSLLTDRGRPIPGGKAPGDHRQHKYMLRLMRLF
jgi:hypothetical protein